MKLLDSLLAHGVLTNESTLEELLLPLQRHLDKDPEYLVEQEVFYHSSDDTNAFNARLELSDECNIKIVRMTKTRNHFNRSWCFGYERKKRGRTFYWKGAFAGTYESVFNGVKNLITNKRGSVRRKSDGQLTLPQSLGRMHILSYEALKRLAASVFENLLDQREWDDLSGIEGLMGHISGLAHIARNKYLQPNNEFPDVLRMEQDGVQAMVFNSGLLDKYTNFVLLHCTFEEVTSNRFNEKHLTIKTISVIARSAVSISDRNIPVIETCPRNMYRFPSDDISLDHSGRLDHMFSERWSRLSEDLNDSFYSPDLLFASLQSSVDLALKMNQIDSNYIMPRYNLKQDEISYLIPLYVGSSVFTKPVCAVTVSFTREGVWAPITVLTLKMARGDARLINKLKNTWLLS